jgi:hypothetical protein
VSTALPFAGVGELAHSPVESAAFGFDVARISVGGAWSAELGDADEVERHVAGRLARAAEDTVILRFPSDLVEVARLDPRDGRQLRHAGTLLYWEDPSSADATHDTEIGVGVDVVVSRGGSAPPPGFIASATAVIADSFEGYLNHYAYNTRIPAAIARDGYVDWARRTIADTAGVAILLTAGDSAIAAATLRIHTDGDAVVGEVELASVAKAEQGAGRYRDLWSAIRRAAREASAERLIISTQASNIRVQRAWARLGLVPLMSFDTCHVVAPRAADPLGQEGMP